MLFKSRNTLKKHSNVIRIFLIVLFAIVIDQGMESVLLEAIAPFDLKGTVSNTFLAISIPCAIFLASLSDFHCRRNVMMFALTALVLSGIFISIFEKIENQWLAYVALACKGIGGNVTPIALASLATVLPTRKLTISIAIAICAYSLGSWVPIYFRSFDHLSVVVTILSFLCYLVSFKWFKETEFDDFRFGNRKFPLKDFISFAAKDIKLIVLFCAITPVILVFLGFIFSEISFYQILLRGEVLIRNDFYSKLSLKMGIGYYIGTGILYFLQKRNISDAQCLKLGVIIALLAGIASSIFAYIFAGEIIFYNFSILCFSFGFALITPSLFSMLSKISRLDEQGKIYGLLDSTDTISALVSTKYIKLSKSASYALVFLISSTIFIISAMFFVLFIHYVQKKRKGDERRIKETEKRQ